MLNTLPLLGKKVLVPRGEKQAKSFSRLVEQYGGIPVEIPLIAFRPIHNNERLENCLQALDTFDWLIFTSNTAVETFFSFITKETVSKLPKIAVIGKKTEEVLLERGLQVDFVPSAFVAEVFAEEFTANIHRGLRVLIPKGNLARDYIADILTEAGAQVDEVVIYENYLPDESRNKLVAMLRERQLDILLFTSSSTVDHFMTVVNEHGLSKLLDGCTIGCIGPVTERKLREYGLPVHASPEEYTVAEMIKSTIDYLEKQH
jgi:uroporphyrinogen-III synthase